MLSSTLLQLLASSAVLARLGHASPVLQPRDDDDDVLLEYNPGNKTFPHYTALGDSYASGIGFSDSADGNEACHRTVTSYPKRLLDFLGGELAITHFNFAACAGSNDEGVISQIESVAPEVELPMIGHDFGSPDLVTISVGITTGNIMAEIVEKCIASLYKYWDADNSYINLCEVAWYNSLVTIWSMDEGLSKLFDKAMTTNLAEGQKREVYVLGYPQFYATDRGWKDCPEHDAMPHPPLDTLAKDVNGIVLELNKKLKSTAEQAGAVYVDIDAAFEGHRLCDKEKDTWFQRSLGDVQDIVHPNDDGYEGMMNVLEKAILGEPVEYELDD
ncbi:MAG: hypothetical protein HETSPECPRED_006546 [Heterodermia speciosa]|uniref:SGNH hydrolase-type esterase domain-containing protein n=1 Tax=Heterodermia speciosa TaxID=116794 RepID=A0A8H3FML0_9LECA|nr:MAG: hypothetical protein HETSPECPRED_006546 [Heterodermia speciosa]